MEEATKPLPSRATKLRMELEPAQFDRIQSSVVYVLGEAGSPRKTYELSWISFASDPGELLVSIVERFFLLILEFRTMPTKEYARECSVHRNKKVGKDMMQGLSARDQLRLILHYFEGVDQALSQPQCRGRTKFFLLMDRIRNRKSVQAAPDAFR